MGQIDDPPAFRVKDKNDTIQYQKILNKCLLVKDKLSTRHRENSLIEIYSSVL